MNIEQHGHEKVMFLDDAPVDFIPKRLAQIVMDGGLPSRAAWECALMLKLQEELKSGSISVGIMADLIQGISYKQLRRVSDCTDIGEVRRIGIRACIIRTAEGSEIIVPNGTIIANKVTNWTSSDRYRAVEVPVSVAAAWIRNVWSNY
jgi:Mechanosensitive ion channel